ncbi:hypothetical protein LPJ77_007124, partial [Coemansia sp. RSA 2523]
FDQDDYLISMAEWFRDFSFVLIIKGIKDACHIAYKPGEHMDSLNDQLESAIPYIHWDVVESLTKHVAVDYGIEWMPLDRTEQMTLAWYLPHLEDVVKTHGANKIDQDMYCHFPDFGGLRSELSVGVAPEICEVGGGLYCQYYLNEKSLVYNYELAHGKKKLDYEEVLKNSHSFQTLMRR